MNSQEKKAWLRQCAALDRDIDRLILERSRWMARATRMVPTLSDMPRGGGERRSSEDIILRIAEIENEIDRKIDALLDQRAAVVEAITAVGDRQLREVLELRYLDGATFEEIAEEMGLSVRHVLRLHGADLRDRRAGRPAGAAAAVQTV